MDKIDTSNEDYTTIAGEGDPFSLYIKECVNKINEIIDWINNQ